MKLLRELIKGRTLIENRGTFEPYDNVGDALEEWMNATGNYHFEGRRGEATMEEIVGLVGYRGMDDFFEDNPGAREAIVEWIKNQNADHWLEAINNELEEMQEEKDRQFMSSLHDDEQDPVVDVSGFKAFKTDDDTFIITLNGNKVEFDVRQPAKFRGEDGDSVDAETQNQIRRHPGYRALLQHIRDNM